jgi:hypothetical protein
LLAALQAMRSGDFSIPMPGDSLGIESKISDTFNDIIAVIARVTSVVGQTKPSIRVLAPAALATDQIVLPDRGQASAI